MVFALGFKLGHSAWPTAGTSGAGGDSAWGVRNQPAGRPVLDGGGRPEKELLHRQRDCAEGGGGWEVGRWGEGWWARQVVAGMVAVEEPGAQWVEAVVGVWVMDAVAGRRWLGAFVFGGNGGGPGGAGRWRCRGGQGRSGWRLGAIWGGSRGLAGGAGSRKVGARQGPDPVHPAGGLEVPGGFTRLGVRVGRRM